MTTEQRRQRGRGICVLCGEFTGLMTEHFQAKHAEYKFTRTRREASPHGYRYVCATCGATPGEFKDLVRHYRRLHPEALVNIQKVEAREELHRQYDAAYPRARNIAEAMKDIPGQEAIDNKQEHNIQSIADLIGALSAEIKRSRERNRELYEQLLKQDAESLNVISAWQEKCSTLQKKVDDNLAARNRLSEMIVNAQELLAKRD